MVVTTRRPARSSRSSAAAAPSFDGFNRALDMKRPIGSLAKPMVLPRALESGRYTPASVVMDQPVEVKLESGDLWKPGTSTRRSTARSRCCARSRSRTTSRP
jgi:penicillin-binding protein 1B